MRTKAPEPTTAYTCDLCQKTEHAHSTPKGWDRLYLKRNRGANEYSMNSLIIPTYYDSGKVDVCDPLDLCDDCCPWTKKAAASTVTEKFTDIIKKKLRGEK